MLVRMVNGINEELLIQDILSGFYFARKMGKASTEVIYFSGKDSGVAATAMEACLEQRVDFCALNGQDPNTVYHVDVDALIAQSRYSPKD